MTIRVSSLVTAHEIINNLSTIKKYESGERNPKPDQLQKIAEALGISVTVFLDYDINTVSDEPVKKFL